MGETTQEQPPSGDWRVNTKRTFLGWLGLRRWPWVVALIALLLSLPSLGAGLGADDLVQREILQGQAIGSVAPEPLFDLFKFAPPQPQRQALQDEGRLSWWVHPKLNVTFFRPLTAATHMLDYALWPDGFWLHHLHSIFWAVLGVLAVALLYRRLGMGAVAAGLAALMFAVEDAHSIPIGWVANRNSLVALALGVTALGLHLQWRERGRRVALFGAVVAFAAALLAGEAGLGIVAYLFAYQLFLDKSAIGWRRLLPLVPYGALVVAWRLLYVHLGYGALGSDLYVGPTERPLEFARLLIERLPELLFSQFTQVPLEVTMLAPAGVKLGVWIVALLVVALIVRLFLPLLRASAMARFWALGMVLAVVPGCATYPLDRLLGFAGIGAFGLLACQIEQLGWLQSAEPAASCSKARRFGVAALLVAHTLIAAPLLVARLAAVPLIFKLGRVGTDALPTDGTLAGKVLVLVTGSDYGSYNLAAWRRHDGTPVPRRVALLVTLQTHVTVTRTDDETLLLDAGAQGMFDHPAERATRDLSEPFHVGDEIRTQDFVATVMAVTEDGRPRKVSFRFMVSLDDPSLVFFASPKGRCRPFPLPPVGQQTQIEPLSLF